MNNGNEAAAGCHENASTLNLKADNSSCTRNNTIAAAETGDEAAAASLSSNKTTARSQEKAQTANPSADNSSKASDNTNTTDVTTANGTTAASVVSSESSNRSTDGSQENASTANSDAGNSSGTTNDTSNTGATGNENEALLQFLRQNCSPLGNSIRLAGSPRSVQGGPRQAIIIIYVLHKAGGIHGFLYGFRRMEEPNMGSYVEKIHRDQVRGRDPYLLSAPLNILKTTYGAHRNEQPILNNKGYELSTFVAIQNFELKTEETVRQLAKCFGTAIKQHIENDPACQNQEIVVSDNNVHYNENNVFMDFLGERNAVNLYRTILPVDSTPGYSQFNVGHARLFFRQGTLSAQSVALIKSDNTFLATEQHNRNEE